MSRRERHYALGVLIYLAGCVAASAGTPQFKSGVAWPVGIRPVSVAAADFNQDRHMDLAVLNSGATDVGNATISILLGNGDGTFQAPINLAADTNSMFIAAADLNCDHRIDLVITGDNGVTVLLGNGDGSFQSPQHFDGGTSPGMIVVADLDSDRKPDLVVTNANGAGVLMGNGDGTFRSRIDYGISGVGNGTLVVGDFNEDNQQDLAVGTASGLAILLGNGDGTFVAPVSAGGSSSWNVRAAADFNHDGKLDLLVDNGTGGICGGYRGLHFCGAPMGILFGKGDGTFQPPTIVDPTSVSLSAIAADFDGDNNVDVGVVTGSSLEIYTGDGHQSFSQAVNTQLHAPDSNGGFSVGALALDVNGDRAPDVIGVNRGLNSVVVLLNSTPPEFSISTSSVSPITLNAGQSATSAVTLAQLNAFNTPVSLTCSVQPAQLGEPTCALSATSVRFDSTRDAQVTLTIADSTASASRLSFPEKLRRSEAAWFPVVGFAFAGMGLSRIPSRKMRLPIILVGLVLLAGLASMTACGSSRSSGVSTKFSTYNVTVTGTSGATQHSTAVTVAVQ